MTTPPLLGPRALASFRRLELELGAMQRAMAHHRLSGALSPTTITVLDQLRRRANGLFGREPSLPWFPMLAQTDAISHADLTLMLARLSAAIEEFRALHADQIGTHPDGFDDDIEPED